MASKGAVTPVLFLSGEVNEDLTMKVVPFLYHNPDRKITVFLNTKGGDVQQALQIYELFKNHGRVTVVAIAECYSAGTIILLGGTGRLATKETEFLIHYGQEVLTTERDLKRSQETYNRCEVIYRAAMPGLGEELYEKFMNTDVYLNYDAATELGLITGEYKLATKKQ